MKYTPLYEDHVKLGAKIVEFAGYYMPLQYDGIVAEVERVRKEVGMFDVSHMGEFVCEGPDAVRFANYVVTNDFGSIDFGDIIYTAMCNENGGFVDDLLVYKIAPERIMFVVNASNIDKDFNHIMKLSNGFDVKLTNVSDDTGLIAIQGPKTQEMLQPYTDLNLDEIGYYSFKEGSIFGVSGIISRTGYTGEDGFELYIPANQTTVAWRKLLEIGIRPAGLGARDVLRLEAGLLLYGNDMDDTITPLEASIPWAVKFEKGDFYGKEALLKQKEAGLKRRLRGITLETKLVPRHEMEVFKDGQKIGYVTSGTFSPTLGRPIAFVMIDANVKIGDTVQVLIRDKYVDAKVVKTPFYRGSVRSKK
ncbi:MAG TPA: glycine cleavage system aminomethyltransferase GcvT [Fervidobacterium sp.]|nr:glycine cleavage system aminomethyltransferase GcvT [Fervidobacterium sp.]HOH52622.1 glycine cleavage system aminomethyltransferase GcvT [Fervidobacterium sp.]HOL03342.1 glycine cleavage system aminomethyltransferase GcvT [Fervidobacterium sp.]HPC23891.1 glycine cleavage system aminomethyltransferase GcvT [Fervidobacterium sp.]HQG01946.1 glycine cleavage system aminomethyltransferase GcvT [Fervidobacterium sp.]